MKTSLIRKLKVPIMIIIGTILLFAMIFGCFLIINQSKDKKTLIDIQQSETHADAVTKNISKSNQSLKELKESYRKIASFQMGEKEKEGLSEKVSAHKKRKQDMRDMISSLNESYDTTISEKLGLYKSTLDAAYEDAIEDNYMGNKEMLAKVFFGIDSVQEELKQMDSEQRNLEIDRIRREMGYSQEETEESKKMDKYREKRWSNGLTYMKEREDIAQRFEGLELEKQLKELREKSFKHEAKTIEFEEKDGFFRFERRRIYGRN